MRLLHRLFAVAAVVALPAGLALFSCGTDAVGVDACRQIETARCDVAPLCTPGFDVNRCILYYRDECLNGIQNPAPDAGDPSTLAPACVQAINAVAGCVDAGQSSSCPSSLLAPDASIMAAGSCTDWDPNATAGCNLILHCPDQLAACNFIAAPPTVDAGDAGDADADADTDDADATTDAGDAATD